MKQKLDGYWICIVISMLTLFPSCIDADPEEERTDKFGNTSADIDSKVPEGSDPQLEKVLVVKTMVDSMVMAEIGQYQNYEWTIFESYNRDLDSYENWSEKLWGRCCCSADIQYSEFIYFDVSTNFQVNDYPLSNALSPNYIDPYVFKTDERVTLDICLDLDSDWFTYEGEPGLNPRVLVNKNDTVLFPFQFTMINGFVKSEKDYYANARIKTAELWHNEEHVCNVLFSDSPEPQIISLDVPFLKYDRLQLKPIEFYPGSTYDDVCISAFQKSILHSVYKPFNKKYTNKYYGK